MYDLIVVGGGPAGSMCARKAALEGLSVLLIEKDKFPRSKLCGGALSPRVSDSLDFDISSIVQLEMHDVVVIAPSGRKVSVHREDVKGHLIKRAEFDHFLIKKADEAGVNILEDTKVQSVEQTRSGIRVLTHGDSFKSHLLVGADGANSTVARSLDIRKKWPSDRVALCIAADIPLPHSEIIRILSTDGTSDRIAIEMYLWAVEHGYGWCFPKHDEISLGIGYKMKHKVLNLRDAWKAFVRKFEYEKGISLDISSQSAFRVPLGKLNGRIITRRTMLVGDAAGLVSPITGEGIHYAIRSGIIAAEVASEAVREKNPLHVKMYETRLKKEMKTDFNAANFVSDIAFKSEKKIEIICELADTDMILQNQMIDLALGTRSISKIRMEMTKRLLTRYPRNAFRLLR